MIQEPQLALVIELVQGQALSDVIAQTRQQALPGAIPCLPFAPAWHYFSQLLGALAAIHALGIVQRDIKPANLLIRTDGIEKLTDFGIARLPADEVRDTGGMAPGTGAYMSPEQVTGKDLDARADLYSAAIVLYEMLAGVTPFEGEGRNEIMVRSAQLEEPARPITRLVHQAPAVLDLLFARALAKDPVHRYPSAQELGHAIEAALGLEPSEGWDAQLKLAQRAQAISQLRPAGLAPTDPMEREAEKLRTGVMAAYSNEPG
jgi:serine/threonine protein kinase